MRDGARVLLSVLVGTFLVQCAWILLVPPFRGIDEHEHAYRAAAVARGDFSPHHRTSPQGWGEYLYVPRDIVEAARPACGALIYTTPDNCVPGPARNGLVRIASQAASYNPAFYWVIGTAARPFHGVAALMAMRVATALISSLLIACAALVTASWARSVWPRLGLLAGLTPMLLYSTSVAAPNGPEMAAGALLWAALIGLARRSTRPVAWYFPWVVLSAVPLVTLRGLGPVWCLLIVCCALPLADRARIRTIVRTQGFMTSCLLVGAATVLAGVWTFTAKTGQVTFSGPGELPSLPSVLPGQWVLWVFQSVGAFPLRNEAAPMALYALALAGYATGAALAVRAASWRVRTSLALVVAAASAVGIAATVGTYHRMGGLMWQGRYMLPLTVGAFLLAGAALDSGRTDPARTRLAAGSLTGTFLASIAIIGQLSVRHRLLDADPSAYATAWLTPPEVLIVSLTVVGVALQVRGAVADSPSRRAAPNRPAEADADTIAR